MASTLELKLSEHQSAQRSTDHAINQHSQDITKNEKALQTAKNQLKVINDSTLKIETPLKIEKKLLILKSKKLRKF